jgi:DNA polymerase-1
VLRRHGVGVRGYADDTMLQSFVLNAGGQRHDMDSLAARYLGYSTIRYEDVAGKGAKQISFSQVALEEPPPTPPRTPTSPCACTASCRRSWRRAGLTRVYREIEMPLVPVLERMEANGVSIDMDELRRQSALLAQRMHALQQRANEMRRAAGQPRLDQAAGQLLFEELKLPALVKTPAARPRPTRRRWRRSPTSTSCRGWCSSTAAWQAAQHLHREAAADAQPGHRPRAHQLPPGRRRHRAAVLERSQPAEHPDPQRGRPAHPPGLRRAAGRGSSPATTRRSSCGSWRTCPRIPAWSPPSPAAPTCTPPPPRKCSG